MKVNLEIAKRIDFKKIAESFRLAKTTLSSLENFEKRYNEAVKTHYELSKEDLKIDFESYRKNLKNGKIVDSIKLKYESFVPKKIDIKKNLELIEKFQKKAIESAEKAKKVTENEINELRELVEIIKKVRSYDEITESEIMEASPDLKKIVEYMEENDKLTVRIYDEEVGNKSLV